MGRQNFSIWLINQLASSRHALLSLLEKRDRLLYIEAPALRKEYMEKIGSFEEGVLESELMAAQLQRKIELIQIALNQRKPVDLEAIERQLGVERGKRLKELEAADKTARELPALGEAEQQELRSKYRRIVHDFHPQVNSEITATQRELYEKALDAYKRQSLEAIRIIFDMLYDTSGLEKAVSAEPATLPESAVKAGIQELSDMLASDYSLAGELYSYFSKTETDVVIAGASERHTQQRGALEEEIESIQSNFPFNAQETLQSPKLTEEYLSDLKVRMRQSEGLIAERTRKIERMLEGVKHGGKAKPKG